MREAGAERFLARQVADPVLREKLTPTYTPGCKRLLQSNDYYPALQRPNVSVETEKIIELRPEGVVTADGTLHAVDTIIYGTGFRITDNPMAEKVHGGRRPHVGGVLGRHRHAGLLRDDHPRLPQLLHAGRPQHGHRAHLPRRHDRGPGGARGRRPARPARPWRGRGGGAARRPRALEHRGTGEGRADGVELGRVLELVPR